MSTTAFAAPANTYLIRVDIGDLDEETGKTPVFIDAALVIGYSLTDAERDLWGPIVADGARTPGAEDDLGGHDVYEIRQFKDIEAAKAYVDRAARDLVHDRGIEKVDGRVGWGGR